MTPRATTADAGRLLDPGLYSGGDPSRSTPSCEGRAVCWVDREAGASGPS